MSEWRDQEVRNESRSRERNEWIAETRGSLALDLLAAEVYVCECSDPACGARISLTRIEYEDVRGYPTHFAIATDHENRPGRSAGVRGGPLHGGGEDRR